MKKIISFRVKKLCNYLSNLQHDFISFEQWNQFVIKKKI